MANSTEWPELVLLFVGWMGALCPCGHSSKY